jgi:hypothetical protein
MSKMFIVNQTIAGIFTSERFRIPAILKMLEYSSAQIISNTNVKQFWLG